ncbi:MAG: hypothetical protein ACR2OR_13330, partial [Hyphomicrobiales bacterium]
CVLMLPQPKTTEGEKFDTGIYAVYRRILHAAIRMRYLTIAIAVAGLVASAVAFGSVTQLFFQHRR